MDAFEEIVTLVAHNKGYWTTTRLKIRLEPEEKKAAGLAMACPRWEFDVVAYNPEKNELLAIECKSFLDSRGVCVKNGKLQREDTYKLFNDLNKRRVVLDALQRYLVGKRMCRHDTVTKLVLAAGKIQESSRDAVHAASVKGDWQLWSDYEIARALLELTDAGYEDNVAAMTAKIITRYLRRDHFVSNGDDIEIL